MTYDPSYLKIIPYCLVYLTLYTISSGISIDRDASSKAIDYTPPVMRPLQSSCGYVLRERTARILKILGLMRYTEGYLDRIIHTRTYSCDNGDPIVFHSSYTPRAFPDLTATRRESLSPELLGFGL